MRLITAMLADDAFVANNGKLYIHGGAWSRLHTPVFPTTHPKMAVVLVLEVEYGEALKSHDLEVVLVRDGEPLGPRAQGQLNVGHAPGTQLGAPAQVPIALPFPMLTFDSPGRYEWDVLVDGTSLGQVDMEIVPVKLPPGIVGPTVG